MKEFIDRLLGRFIRRERAELLQENRRGNILDAELARNRKRENGIVIIIHKGFPAGRHDIEIP
jgi:hypothetical protein